MTITADTNVLVRPTIGDNNQGGRDKPGHNPEEVPGQT
jgi:hypothetical protein